MGKVVCWCRGPDPRKKPPESQPVSKAPSTASSSAKADQPTEGDADSGQGLLKTLRQQLKRNQDYLRDFPEDELIAGDANDQQKQMAQLAGQAVATQGWPALDQRHARSVQDASKDVSDMEDICTREAQVGCRGPQPPP